MTGKQRKKQWEENGYNRNHAQHPPSPCRIHPKHLFSLGVWDSVRGDARCYLVVVGGADKLIICAYPSE
jgi:hypothetical protein